MNSVIRMVSDDDLESIERELESIDDADFHRRGKLLQEIRDKKSYEKSYQNFEQYMQERWEQTDVQASRIIAAAAFCKRNELPLGNKPRRETHVRPLLLGFPDDDAQRVSAWLQIVESVHGDIRKIKARDVIDTVERIKAAKARDWITLSDWEKMTDDEHAAAFSIIGNKSMNKQDSKSIEWAQWSWNPVTGCKHDCPYCYARDLANLRYAQGFEPSLYPARLSAPANTTVPKNRDPSFSNIFTCSMADLFGRWVPAAWIERVLDVARSNAQWNFLFLTKFPKRMAEFDIPHNAWMGTTVDCQARVKAAEDAFARVTCDVKWLSIEPMLEPITFKRLDLFNWIVIGGASRSSATPAFVPPLDWIVPLHTAARAASCAIYYKDNGPFHEDERIREFPWQRNPIPTFAPDAFRYLGSHEKEVTG